MMRGRQSGHTRRNFLLGGAASPWLLKAAGEGEPIVDSHVHLFLPEFAYHPNASYRPPAHPLSDYLAFLKQSPITHAVVVHPEPYQDDHRILDYVFQHEPSPLFFKSTCLFDPIDPKTPDRMAALSARYCPRIVGIRIHEVHKPGTPPATAGPIKDRDFKDPGLKNVFRMARQVKMAIQFHFIPYYAPQVAALAREFPEVPVLLDHLARAHEGTAEDVEQVMLLGKLPNVYMKYSGSYAGDAALARRAFDAFGPDHMICGYVGMNVEDYRKWSGNFERAFSRVSATDREKIRVRTAMSVFRWQGEVLCP
jgi:predicted TIM-barrel fold metal-dependent hydrolase